MYATSHGYNSSDEENALTSEQAAWVLQTWPGSPLSPILFLVGLLHDVGRLKRREMRVEDFLIDKDDEFPEPEVLLMFGTWRHSLRPRFTPYQARADAHTRVVHRGIQNTHLQQGLKDHPFALAQRGKVC